MLHDCLLLQTTQYQKQMGKKREPYGNQKGLGTTPHPVEAQRIRS